MNELKRRDAFVTGATSVIANNHATDWFLRYPVMSTLRPAYPRGPWHYKNMHQLVVTYESTAEAVRAVVPKPLQPADGNRVTIEWRHMTEVSGFGPYTEVGHSVACTFQGKPVIYVVQAFLDSESPTLAGREILGFPKRHGEPDLKTVREVLTGALSYGGVQVALATMPYRAIDLSNRLAEIEQELQTTQVVLIRTAELPSPTFQQRSKASSFVVPKVPSSTAWSRCRSCSSCAVTCLVVSPTMTGRN